MTSAAAAAGYSFSCYIYSNIGPDGNGSTCGVRATTALRYLYNIV